MITPFRVRLARLCDRLSRRAKRWADALYKTNSRVQARKAARAVRPLIHRDR